MFFFKKLSRGISPEPTTEPKSFISPEPKEDEDFFCGNVGCQNAKERPRLKMMRSEKKFIWFDDAVNDYDAVHDDIDNDAVNAMMMMLPMHDI